MPPEILKRQADSFEPDQQVHKFQRLDEEPDANTQPQSRKKKSTAGTAASRTGQACDRCKTRKIRCDDTHSGCLPCRQNNTECRTTDRVTQRATVRGYTENVERDNTILRQHILELESQVKELGGEPKTTSQYASVRDQEPRWPLSSGAAGQPWNRNETAYDAQLDHRIGQEANLFAIRSEGRGNESDGWFGISPANSLLSPVKGASLTLFGMRIDISDFTAIGSEGHASPASYMTLMNLMASRERGRTPELLANAKLPDAYSDALSYTRWYIQAVNPWLPVLHKPQMLELIYRWYHEPNFQPTIAELVMVHMTHSAMKYHIAVRNHEDPFTSDMMIQSFAHYHYTLGFLSDLVVGRTLQDMQALTLVTFYIRTVAKPDFAWQICNWTMSIAVEFGLHRSARAWGDESSKKNAVDIEVGKRVFYSLLLIHVTLSGRLGRPMPLRLEDFDVELPEPMDDSVPSDDGVPSPPHCSWGVTLEFFKMTVVFLETYHHVYAVRPSSGYERNMHNFDSRLERWKRELPLSLTEAALADERSENRIFALWVQLWEADYRMLLHHPSLSKTLSQDLANQNLDICMSAASKYIELTLQIRNLKCLDSTWVNTVSYIAAIFTLLFAYWERRDQISSTDFAKLRLEMEQCLDVFGDIGLLLGTGHRLKEAIRPIIDRALGQMDRFMVEKTASAAVARAGLSATPSSSHPRRDPTSTDVQDLSSALQATTTAAANDPDLKPINTYATPQDHTLIRPHSAYQPALYPDAVDAASTHFYSPYDASPNTYAAALEARMSSAQHPAQPSNPEAYMFNLQHASYPAQHVTSGVAAWRQWTETLKDQLEPADYIGHHSAGALVGLSGRGEVGQGLGMELVVGDMAAVVGGQGGLGLGLGPGATTASQWPMNAYDVKEDKHA